jgi:hypothetical protein
MAVFLLESKRLYFHLNGLDSEGLAAVKAKIQEGVKKGAISGAWGKVGGGSVWIVEAESHAALARRLRELGVGGWEVTPLLDHANLIDAHIAHRAAAAKAKASKAKK